MSGVEERSRRPGLPVLLAASLPAALGLDYGVLVVLIRSLHAARGLAIAVAFVLCALAWGAAAAGLGALSRRRARRHL